MKPTTFLTKLKLACQASSPLERGRQFTIIREILIKEARVNKEQQDKIDLVTILLQ